MPRSRSTGVARSSRERGRATTASRSRTPDGVVAVELHLGVDWGVNIPAAGAAVQTRVAEYLERMADLTAASVDVVVDDIGPPPEGA